MLAEDRFHNHDFIASLWRSFVECLVADAAGSGVVMHWPTQPPPRDRSSFRCRFSTFYSLFIGTLLPQHVSTQVRTADCLWAHAKACLGGFGRTPRLVWVGFWRWPTPVFAVGLVE